MQKHKDYYIIVISNLTEGDIALSDNFIDVGNELCLKKHVSNNGRSVEIDADVDGVRVGYSRLSVDKISNVWTISEWFVNSNYQNKGYGRTILFTALNELYTLYGLPFEIQYVWNGQNMYVYEWLKKYFKPISGCPIAIQKIASDDDWDSHIYKIDRDKVLKYFNINV